MARSKLSFSRCGAVQLRCEEFFQTFFFAEECTAARRTSAEFPPRSRHIRLPRGSTLTHLRLNAQAEIRIGDVLASQASTVQHCCATLGCRQLAAAHESNQHFERSSSLASCHHLIQVRILSTCATMADQEHDDAVHQIDVQSKLLRVGCFRRILLIPLLCWRIGRCR